MFLYLSIIGKQQDHAKKDLDVLLDNQSGAFTTKRRGILRKLFKTITYIVFKVFPKYFIYYFLFWYASYDTRHVISFVAL